jgi:hypothetical protein
MPFSLNLGLTDNLTAAQDRWSQWWMNVDRSIHEAPANQDYYVMRVVGSGGMATRFHWDSDDDNIRIWWRVDLTNRQVVGHFQFLTNPGAVNRYRRWFRRGRNMLTYKMDTLEEFASTMLVKGMPPAEMWCCCDVYARLLNCLEPGPSERHEIHQLVDYDS